MIQSQARAACAGAMLVESVWGVRKKTRTQGAFPLFPHQRGMGFALFTDLAIKQ